MAFYYIIFLCSILCFNIHSSVKAAGGITVDFIHRDSSLSPYYDPSSARFQRLRSAFHRALSRKSSFVSSSISIDAPVSAAGWEYLMKIKIGTPPVEQLLIADTGSDLLWTQCKPCTQCNSQNLPLFDPSRTSSYRSVSCRSEKCAASGSSSCDYRRNGCQYQVAYLDGSYSIGELAVDTLSFDGVVSFPKVAFGCGHQNGGLLSSGIVGLGGGSISIVKQLKSTIGGRFSYCLTMLDSNASSKISFGSNAVVIGPEVVSTPFVKKSPATFYHLTLEGLSVGKERIDYTKEEGNIIIDSGTTLTFVPSEFYDRVESAMEKAIRGTRVSDSQGMLKLCYKMKSEGYKLRSPPVTAHFKGADLVLPEESIFVEVEEGIACLTLVPSQDFAIFGNLHQINHHIGYDLVKEQVSFLPTDCSKIYF